MKTALNNNNFEELEINRLGRRAKDKFYLNNPPYGQFN